MPKARARAGRRVPTGGWGEGRKKERRPIHDCVGKWVKRQVERAANLNHRQFCAVQFDSARSFRNLPPSPLPFFTFFPSLSYLLPSSFVQERLESASQLLYRCLIRASTIRARRILEAMTMRRKGRGTGERLAANNRYLSDAPVAHPRPKLRRRS